MVRALALSCSVLVAACSFDPIALEGKECPCAVGWVCDSETNRCVETPPRRDAGMDAALPAEAGFDASHDGSTAVETGPVGADSGPDTGSPPDAAVEPDAGPDRTACDDVLAGAMFCDGFEDGSSFASWADTWTEDGVLAWESAIIHRGDGALRAETTVAGGAAALIERYPAITSGEIYVRFYVYVPASASTVHYDFVFIGESSSPYQGIVLAMPTSTEPFVYVHETDSYFPSGTALTRDRWHCLQLRIDVAGSSLGSVELAIDGTTLVSETGVDTLPTGGYEALSVGIPYSNTTQPPTRIYFEEVAIGRAPLPCDS